MLLLVKLKPPQQRLQLHLLLQ